jgi:hypothetical protein
MELLRKFIYRSVYRHCGNCEMVMCGSQFLHNRSKRWPTVSVALAYGRFNASQSRRQRYPVLGSTARIEERFKNFQNKVTDSGTSMKQTWFVWLVTITFDFFGAKAALRPSDRSSRGQGASTRPKAK